MTKKREQSAVDKRINMAAKLDQIKRDTNLTLNPISPSAPYADHNAMICIPVAPVLALPDYRESLQTQFLFGTRISVHAKCMAGGEQWVLVQEVLPNAQGYVGFIPASAVMTIDAKPTHSIACLKSPIFTKPDLKSPIRHLLPLGSKVRIEGGSDAQFQYARGLGYAHIDHIQVLPDVAPKRLSSDDINAFVETAELHFGLPYIWGGTSTDGLDCSGLVQSALRSIGYDNAPRDADQQEAVLGQALDFDPYLSGLRRGDLVFWPGHVGIMGDDQMLLHANAHHMGVAIEPLIDAQARIEETKTGPIRSIKRLS